MSCQVFVGCQAASKTISNIAEATKWIDVLGCKALMINSNIDTRDVDNIISSNSSSYKGLSDKFDIHKVDRLCEVLNLIDNYQIICIDEIQFYPDLEDFVRICLNKGKHIICSGLDSDWLGNDFGEVSKILKLSTSFIKLSAKCLWCRERTTVNDLRAIPDACRTGKLTASKKQIEAGGKDKYVPLCLPHHREHLVEIHGLEPDIVNILSYDDSDDNSDSPKYDTYDHSENHYTS